MQDQLRLNSYKDTEGLYEYRGRIQGSYPIYLPGSAVLSEKWVQVVPLLTFHGGVLDLTMASIRRDY